MRNLFLKITLMAIVAVSFTSCSKYDEGSKFTLLTKKARLVNDWEIQKLTANGTDITNCNIITGINIKKDGTITTSGSVLGFPTITNGTWVFDNDKSHVIVTNGEELENYEIIRLKNNWRPY